MPFIAFILLFALIVAAVDGGCLVLALHLQLLLNITADSPLHGADGSVTVAALTVSAIVAAIR